MKMKLTIVICLLGSCGIALAQMTPQMQQQLPPSDPSSSQYHSVYLPAHGVGDTVQPGANERWEDRWGAIAIDEVNGVAGAVTDLTDERAAKRAAITECKNRGGIECELSIAYVNQCAVVITGDQISESIGARTIEQASKLGMEACRERGDSNCRVYYSACSLPVRAQ